MCIVNDKPVLAAKQGQPYVGKAEPVVDENLHNAGQNKTFTWWMCLSGLAMVNISVWCKSYDHFKYSESAYTKLQLYLSGVYVLVCAYRSIYPRIDLERYCLFDTQLSSIFLGRLSATVAEICFSCQFALLFIQIDQLDDSKDLFLIKVATKVLVPSITVAQMCCWCGVWTLESYWHAIEESIWAVMSLLLCGCFASIWVSNTEGAPYEEFISQLAVTGLIISLLYFAFMVTVDVPMYIEKSKQKVGQAKSKSSVRSIKDIWSRRVITTNWKVWRHEAPWLTGYFSTAVWISMSLIYVSTRLQS